MNKNTALVNATLSLNSELFGFTFSGKNYLHYRKKIVFVHAVQGVRKIIDAALRLTLQTFAKAVFLLSFR